MKICALVFWAQALLGAKLETQGDGSAPIWPHGGGLVQQKGTCRLGAWSGPWVGACEIPHADFEFCGRL